MTGPTFNLHRNQASSSPDAEHFDEQDDDRLIIMCPRIASADRARMPLFGQHVPIRPSGERGGDNKSDADGENDDEATDDHEEPAAAAATSPVADAHFASEQGLFDAPAPASTAAPITLETFLAMGHVENCWCGLCPMLPPLPELEQQHEQQQGSQQSPSGELEADD